MRIDRYEFGRITIDRKEYTSDVVVYPDHVEAGWWRKEGHRLNVEDLEKVFEFVPEVLVIGTGAAGMMVVPEQVVKELNKRGIKVVIEKTKDACRIFNDLIKEGRKVVAALHLTC